MPYLTVIILAAAAGGGVAAFTLWEGRPRPTQPVGATGSQAHALPSTPTPQTRMIGALGLLAVVLAGAGLIAAVCYLAYAVVKHAVG